MPCNYNNYPSNWKTEIRPAILKRANNCCEFCGVRNYETGYRSVGGFFVSDTFIVDQLENYAINMFDNEISLSAKRIKIILTIAHLDHNTKNNDYENLRALCQKCHNNWDAKYRLGNRIKKNISKQLNLL